MYIIFAAILIWALYRAVKHFANNPATHTPTEVTDVVNATPSAVRDAVSTFRTGVTPAITKGREAVHEGYEAGKTAKTHAVRQYKLNRIDALMEQLKDELHAEEVSQECDLPEIDNSTSDEEVAVEPENVNENV
jgi:hypothetical protein